MRSPELDARYANVPMEISEERGSMRTRPLPPDGRKQARLLLRLPDGTERPLEGKVQIGTSALNDVVIENDECVSRKHCVIEVDRMRVRVRDLGSTNGTHVNGVRITTAELQSGAALSIGSTRLRVVVDAGTSTIIGESAPILAMREQIARLAPTGLSVLIQGETGTGKELVALALHEQSGRRGGFVPVNCGSIPKDLVESELFGHERGAFTGATGKRNGVFQEADGGTLFLDEIGELPLGLQTRLLRVLETGMVRPVGATREQPVNVRVVAATHLDVRAAVADGRFRQDLFFRLVGAEIHTPPLRERGSDIALLARRFLSELNQSTFSCRLTDEALEAIERHSWPGNVRELRQVLQRASVLGGPLLNEDDLSISATLAAPEVDLMRVDGRDYREIEIDVLTRALRRAGGNRRAAAHALGIPKSTLCDKVKRYRIPIETYDEEPTPALASAHGS